MKLGLWKGQGKPIGLEFKWGSRPQSTPTAAMGWRAYWNAMDAATLFTDGGTTPVANTGDLVYRMGEKLGVVANSYFEQATETNRPAYTTGGANGKSYLAFDGNDNFMASLAISNFFANNAKTLIVACSVSAGWAADDYIVGGAGDRLEIKVTTGNVLFFRNYDGTNDDTATVPFTDGVPLVITCKHDSGAIYIRKNGGAWSAGVASGNTAAMTELWRIAVRGTAYTPMRFYAHCVANAVVSDANIALVENYIMAQLGL